MTGRDDETLTHGPGRPPDETLTHGGAAAEDLDAEPGWSAGSVVGDRWEVFGSARGGMGRVYFVRDREWGANLAVKSLLAREHVAPDKLETIRHLFRRETQVWLDLGAHPNIVSGFYTLEVGGALRFFMEYVAGQPLAELVREAPLELSRAVDLAIQLCAGMSYVHARDVVHRDLKPANCLIMEDDTLRVTDFGLGKSTADTDVATAPGTDAPIAPADVSQHHGGTPYYMAPEQWQSLGAAGKPADTYAFGVLLYELLAGVRPFTADPETLRRYDGRVAPMLQQPIDGGAPMEQLVLQLFHQQAEPFAPSAARADIPASLDDIARSCLAKAPEARPQFARLREALVREYRDITGHPYRRQLPEALRPSEAGENNRAVSYYTMGQHDKAQSILAAWLTHDPTALYPWINRNTINLRHSKVEPADVADRFALEIIRSHPGAVDDDPSVGEFAGKLAPYRLDHPAKVLAVAVSPDGEAIATGCEDRRVRVFDASGALIETYPECADMVMAVAFVGDRAIAAGSGSQVAVWERGNPEAGMVLAGHGDLITSLVVGRDGRLWSSSNDRTARAWDLGSGHESAQLKKHKEIVRTVAVSPDGETVATCSFDAKLRIWDGRDGSLRHALADGRVVQTTAVFTADGQALWTGGTDGLLRLWDPHGGRLLASHREHDGGLATLALSPDGAMLATAGADRRVRLWDTATAKVARVFDGHRAVVRATVFSPDGARLITAGDDHTARVWPLEPPPPESWPLAIRRDAAVGGRRELAREKRALMAAASDNRVDALAAMRSFRGEHETYRRDDELMAAEHLLGRQLGRPVGCRDAFVNWTEKVDEPIKRVAFSPTGDAVYAATERAVVRYRVDRQAGPEVIAEVADPVACAVTGDGQRVLVADANDVRLWSTDRQLLFESRWRRGAGALHHAATSDDGSLIVAGGWSRSALRASWQAQGTLQGWRTDDGAKLKLKNRGNAALAVAMSADGSLFAVGMDDGKAALWTNRGKRRAELVVDRDQGEVCSIAMARSGQVFAAGTSAGVVHLFHSDRGEALASWSLPGRVESLSITDDEAVLAAATADGTVSLFLTGPPRPLRTLEGHAEAAVAAFGPGGRQLVTAGRDGLLRLWTLDYEWGQPG